MRLPARTQVDYRAARRRLHGTITRSMAEIFPFRALRYAPARVELARVVTQPYDKITTAMQESYYSASPYNLVRIILGKSDPSDGEGNNVYTRAADYLNSWRSQGILAQDSAPSIYLYS